MSEYYDYWKYMVKDGSFNKMLRTPIYVPLLSQFDNNDFNIFKAMENVTGYENVYGDRTAEEMNLEYLYNRSGSKYLSPLVKQYIPPVADGHITVENLNTLAALIYHRFAIKWKALYNTTIVDYNPIENYNMKEKTVTTETGNTNTTGETVNTFDRENTNNTTVTDSGNSILSHGLKTETTESNSDNLTGKTTVTNDLTDTTTYGKNTTDALTHGEVISGESAGNTTTTDNNFAFNTTSETGVPVNRSTAETSTTSSETHSGVDSRSIKDSGNDTVKHTGEAVTDTSSNQSATHSSDVINSGDDITTTDNENKTVGTVKDSGAESNTSKGETISNRDGTVELTRTGNIGVTTTQQMLQSERDLRMWDYYEVLYSDIDSVLAVGIYD